jgi:hypothetical protein
MNFYFCIHRARGWTQYYIGLSDDNIGISYVRQGGVVFMGV